MQGVTSIHVDTLHKSGTFFLKIFFKIGGLVRDACL